ncbi:MAG: type II CAAX endopeptidase family protein [bacterium]|nr:type II CAAX endopeptidase family protein [bacterium]
MRFLNPLLLFQIKPQFILGKLVWLSWFILSVATTVGMAILINLYIDRVLDEITSISPDYFYIISRFFFVFFLFFILFFVVNVVHYKILKKIDLSWQEAHKKLFVRFLLYIFLSPFLFLPVYYFTSGISHFYQTLFIDISDLLIVIFIFDFHKKYRWEEINKAKFRLRSVILFFLVVFAFKIALGIIALHLFTPTNVDTSIDAQWKDLFPILPKTTLEYFLLFFMLCILTPIKEELFFRGIVFNGLKTKYNVFASVIISSLFFAFLHTPNLVVFFLTFFTGILLAIVYQRFKNIWYGVVVHFYINLLPFLLLLSASSK